MRSFFISLVIIFVFHSIFSFSQNKYSNSGQAGNNNKPGKISGTIIDKAINSPVEYATVSIFKMPDSLLVTGTITNQKGFFIIDQLSYGKYRAKISFIGYKGVRIDSIFITPKNPEKKLGTIKLSQGIQLADITITAEKEQIQYNLDKKVINVDKSIVSTGGTATDIMQTIPSVTVDVDGGVSLRGSSNVTILIDGRPSVFTNLDEIPASMIERVEIVTNPSAKFDPEGMSGIINLVLKKKKNKGYSGMAGFNAGTGEKYSSSVNFNFRLNKLNLFTSYDNRFFHMFGFSKLNRESTINDTSYFLSQYQDFNRNGQFNNFKFGADYFFDDKNSLSFSSLYNTRNFKGSDITSFNNMDYLSRTTNYYKRETKSLNKNHENEFTLNYKKTFNEKIRELTADAYYSLSSGDNNNEMDQKYYNTDLTPSSKPDFLQNPITHNINKTFTLQTDYVQPAGEQSRLDLGYKTSIKTADSDYKMFSDSVERFLDSLISNHFVYNEQIHAIYGMYSSIFNKFQYQAGLRAEQAFTNSNQKTTDSVYNNNYFSLFPTIHLKYSFSEDQALQLSYTRRINRPRTRNLNPFVDFTDPQNLSAGNPKLNPEYINAYELEYMIDWNKTTTDFTLFYREINGIISRNVVQINKDTTKTTYENLNTGVSYGLELVMTREIIKGWKINGNVSYFNTSFSGSSLSNSANNGFSWTAKANSTATIFKNLDIQINFNYTAPVVTVNSSGERYMSSGGQGKQKENYSMEIGLKKDFIKDKLSVSCRLSDVFKTSKYEMDTYGTNFKSTTLRKRDSRVLYFGLTYKINGGLKQKNRKKGDFDDSDSDY